MFRSITQKYSSFTNIKYNQGLSKTINPRENRSYGKENRVKAIKKFYDITRETHKPDHKLYTYVKDSEIHPYIRDNYPINMDNYNYSSHYLVKDFNRRWKTNITLEEYYKGSKSTR